MKEALAQGTLRLRRYLPGDAARLYEAVCESRSELTSRGFYRVGYTLQDATEDVYSNIRNWDNARTYTYLIEETPQATFAGQCSITEIEYEHRNAALGWWVRTSRTGCGIATEAARQEHPREQHLRHQFPHLTPPSHTVDRRDGPWSPLSTSGIGRIGAHDHCRRCDGSIATHLMHNGPVPFVRLPLYMQLHLQILHI